MDIKRAPGLALQTNKQKVSGSGSRARVYSTRAGLMVNRTIGVLEKITQKWIMKGGGTIKARRTTRMKPGITCVNGTVNQ